MAVEPALFARPSPALVAPRTISGLSFDMTVKSLMSAGTNVRTWLMRGVELEPLTPRTSHWSVSFLRPLGFV